jgi:hypothetical protein
MNDKIIARYEESVSMNRLILIGKEPNLSRQVMDPINKIRCGFTYSNPADGLGLVQKKKVKKYSKV